MSARCLEVPSFDARSGLDGRASAALRQRLDRWVERGRVAGLQYGVARAGQVVFEHVAGCADAATGAPVVPQTQFNLYSLTKPLTATLVTQLALQGALDPDAPIAQATGIAALRRFGSARDTLLHRAGFPNPMPLRWTHRPEDDDGFDERAFVQQRLEDAAARGRASPRYSNIGYLALGRAVERATRLGYREALQRHLLDALDLQPAEHLAFTASPAVPWSMGHLRRWSLLDLCLGAVVHRCEVVAGATGRWVRLRPHQVDGSAYGGLIGNARGLARFGMAMLGQGGRLDPALSRETASTPPVPEGRTLAWFSGRLAGHLWLGHAGGGLGAYGELRLYPALGQVSVLLTNRPGLRDARLLDGIDAAWLPPVPGDPQP